MSIAILRRTRDAMNDYGALTVVDLRLPIIASRIRNVLNAPAAAERITGLITSSTSGDAHVQLRRLVGQSVTRLEMRARISDRPDLPRRALSMTYREGDDQSEIVAKVTMLSCYAVAIARRDASNPNVVRELGINEEIEILASRFEAGVLRSVQTTDRGAHEHGEILPHIRLASVSNAPGSITFIVTDARHPRVGLAAAIARTISFPYERERQLLAALIDICNEMLDRQGRPSMSGDMRDTGSGRITFDGSPTFVAPEPGTAAARIGAPPTYLTPDGFRQFENAEVIRIGTPLGVSAWHATEEPIDEPQSPVGSWPEPPQPPLVVVMEPHTPAFIMRSPNEGADWDADDHWFGVRLHNGTISRQVLTDMPHIATFLQNMRLTIIRRADIDAWEVEPFVAKDCAEYFNHWIVEPHGKPNRLAFLAECGVLARSEFDGLRIRRRADRTTPPNERLAGMIAPGEFILPREIGEGLAQRARASIIERARIAIDRLLRNVRNVDARERQAATLMGSAIANPDLLADLERRADANGSADVVNVPQQTMEAIAAGPAAYVAPGETAEQAAERHARRDARDATNEASRAISMDGLQRAIDEANQAADSVPPNPDWANPYAEHLRETTRLLPPVVETPEVIASNLDEPAPALTRNSLQQMMEAMRATPGVAVQSNYIINRDAPAQADLNSSQQNMARYVWREYGPILQGPLRVIINDPDT